MAEITLETLAIEIRSLRGEVDAMRRDQSQMREEVGALHQDQRQMREEVGALRQDQRQMRKELSEMGGGVTLSFLAEQQRRLIDEVRETKDDLRVAAAMVQRLDGTVSGLVNEVRAEHARYERLDKRLKAVEGQPVQ